MENNKTCYICLDDKPPLISVCDCKTLFLHKECQEKMIQVCINHHDNCPVCTGKYTNMHTQTVCRIQVGIVNFVFALFCFIFKLCFALFLNPFSLSILVYFTTDKQKIIILACFTFVCMCILLFYAVTKNKNVFVSTKEDHVYFQRHVLL